MSKALATTRLPEHVEKSLANTIKNNPDDGETLMKYIEDLRKDKITVLGENEMFNLKDRHGEIRAFSRVVQLSEKEGTLVQPVPGGPFVVSAQGYEKINRDTGTIVMNADYVLVDGQKQQNPHIVRDERNGRILSIYARSIAFRYSPLGIPQVSDRTTIFDVPAYRLIDLLAKAKKFPQAFKLLPENLNPADEGTWAKYGFDESTSLWVNTSHEEALQFFSQIINREKKAIDFAQTFAQRNAAKHLHGVQKAPGNTWSLPVVCWRPPNEGPIRWDIARYVTTQKAITEMADGKTHGELPEIELKQGIDYVSDEPEMIDAETESDEDTEQNAEQPSDINTTEEAIEDNKKENVTKEPEPDEKLQKVKRQYPRDKAWKQFDAMPEEYRLAAMMELGLSGEITQINAATEILKKASDIADRR